MINPKTGLQIQVLQCSDDDTAQRAGMTCNEFPYFNGGYPLMAKGIQWDDEWEQYECTETFVNHSETMRTNHTFPTNSTRMGDGSDGTTNICLKWSSHEDSPTEYEVGTYECTMIQETELGYLYCQEWISSQKETKKCNAQSYGCEPNCERPIYCYQECCTDSGCSNCNYIPESEWEYTNAKCHEVNDKGACLEWTQEGAEIVYICVYEFSVFFFGNSTHTHTKVTNHFLIVFLILPLYCV